MSFGQIAQMLGRALINNIAATVLFYFAIRFILGRCAIREKAVRSVLGFACLLMAISTSTLIGNQLVNNYGTTLLQNVAPSVMLFLAAALGVLHGAIRNPFEGWVRVPTSVEEGRKPVYVDNNRDGVPDAFEHIKPLSERLDQQSRRTG